MNRYAKRVDAIYRRFSFSQELQHVSESELDAAEEELKFHLPSDYREFLRDYGGLFVATGILNSNVNLGAPLFICMVESFYGVNAANEFKDLVRNYYSRQDLTPPGLLRIGSSDEGCAAMNITAERKGEIYFVKWEEGSDTWEEVCFIAHSFDEFMSLLEPRE